MPLLHLYSPGGGAVGAQGLFCRVGQNMKIVAK